jgi:hypothetical protein
MVMMGALQTHGRLPCTTQAQTEQEQQQRAVDAAGSRRGAASLASSSSRLMLTTHPQHVMAAHASLCQARPLLLFAATASGRRQPQPSRQQLQQQADAARAARPTEGGRRCVGAGVC